MAKDTVQNIIRILDRSLERLRQQLGEVSNLDLAEQLESEIADIERALIKLRSPD